MRKVAILFFVVASLFLVVACSNSSTPIPSPTENSVTDSFETPYSNNVIEDDLEGLYDPPDDTTSSIDNTSTDRVYVGSINSDKYHYPFCQWAQKIYPENEIWFSSEEEAQASGYVPCKVCRP